MQIWRGENRGGIRHLTVGAFVLIATTATVRGEQTVCAVIAAPGSSAATAAELLETNLAKDKTLRLVSRQEIQTVLNEQALSEALSTSGLGSRVRLGKLVHADLLIFLQKSSSKDEQGLLLTIAETRHGLRLAMEPVVWTPDRAEKTIRALLPTIRRARDLVAQQQPRITAVSPFESRDVALDNERRGEAYAAIIEQFLLRQPGVLVVELAEARALAQELAIGGHALTRDLPCYFLGSYKTTSQSSGAVKLSITIELHRGDALLASVTRENVSSEQIGDTLQSFTAELLAKTQTLTSGSAAVKLETALLTQRADLFAKIGENDLAMTLYESILLLEPSNIHAHQELLEEHMELMRYTNSCAWHKQRFPSKYAGRLWHANLGLDHLEALLLHPPVSTQPSDSRPARSSYARDEIVVDTLDRFDFLRGHLFPKTDAVFLAYQHAVRRQSEILLTALEHLDLTRGRGLAMIRLEHAISQAARMQSDADDATGARRTMMRMFEFIDAHCIPRVIVLAAAQYFAVPYDANQAATLLDEMDAGSPGIQLAAQFGRIIYSVKDLASLEKARNDLRALSEKHGLAKITRRLTRTAEMKSERIADWQHWAAEGKALRERTTTQPADQQILPKFEKLELPVPAGRGRTPVFRDWLVCQDDLEIVAMADGIYRLGSSDDLAAVWRPPGSTWQSVQLSWDGRYVWMVTSPFDAIRVLDPQAGSIAEFTTADLPPGIGDPDGDLTAISPGQACFFGYVHPHMYATMLTVHREAGGHVDRHAETFFESRGVGNEFASTVIPSRPPQSSATLPSAIGSEALVLIGRWGYPQLLDVQRRSVRGPTSWPHNAATVLRWQKGYFIGAGSVYGGNKQRATLYSAPDLISTPKVLVNFDWHPFDSGHYGWGPYYGSMVIFENHLHLLALRGDFEGRAPAWVAVDLTTHEPRVLAEDLRPRFPSRYGQKLFVSPHYGLLFASDGQVFRVNLPPMSQCPPVATRPVDEEVSRQ